MSVRIERGIDRGLEFLAHTQSGEGSWRSNGGSGTYPVAMTGLSAMGFVASGSTPTRGKYWHEVRRAEQFLLERSDPDTGLIAGPEEGGRPMFGHGFAMLFLASIYGMEEDVARRRLDAVLHRAVGLTCAAQSSAGGWYYTPDSGGDEGSMTVTQLQALRACRNAGIAVNARTIHAAVEYIRKSQNPDGGLRYRAGEPGESRPAITGAGVVVLRSAGLYDDEEVAMKALRFAQKMLRVSVDTTHHHYYAHLYFAQALYQRGGKEWDDYYAAMSEWLLAQQLQDGSWNGDGVGTVYGTAIALTILQLPQALVPIYQR